MDDRLRCVRSCLDHCALASDKRANAPRQTACVSINARTMIALIILRVMTQRDELSRCTAASTEQIRHAISRITISLMNRKLPNGEYNHSTVITLLSPKGEIVRQSSVIGRADESL